MSSAVARRQVDVAIIGAGTAGMSAWRAVRRAGKSALLIESGVYGTTCARVGCMPSKLLIAAADVAHSARTAAPFGIRIPEIGVDGGKVMERVRSERDRFVGFVLQEIDTIDPSDKLEGHARFLSDNTLMVGEHTEVQAGAVVLATGSHPFMAGDFSRLGDRLIVNDDVFDWQTLPRRVLVVGAGVIGLELGQALSRLSVRTCLISRSDSLAGITDPQVIDSARAAFTGELDLRSWTTLDKAWLEEGAVHAELLTRAPDASPVRHVETVDYVLMAAGRRPNLQGLGLENTSVPFDDRGHPQINPATLQLGAAPIFIAGDVSALRPILHEAADEGRMAGTNAANWPQPAAMGRRVPLGIVFTDPQIAHVGLRWRELDPSTTVVGEVDFTRQGRARIMRRNKGCLRVYADRTDGRFLGAEMAGPDMEHMAHLLAWACQQALGIPQMLAMPFYHPVTEEGLRTALRDAARQLRVA
ncbi:MAG: dihydrolipoyl dehydrogenase [Castellaniella sp.]